MTEQRSADRYHHGDLRNALVEEATALAREGGPDAVVLREVARRVGVSAAAAYHHFASHEAIVQAVKDRSLAILTGQMRAALAGVPEVAAAASAGGDPAASARARLRGLGNAYLCFAVAEPGLFRVAFGPRGPWPTAADDEAGIEAEDGPFPLLSQVLDDLAAAGGLPVERRPGLEYVVWAGVHGVAVLYLDGPLARLGSAERDQMFTRVLDATIRGL
jgi:AcrR family transcriptional regulator